jgi:hypothetical protein
LVYDTTKDTNESEKKHFASRKIVEFNLRAIRGVFPELSHHLRVVQIIGPSPMPPLVTARRLGISLIQQMQLALLQPDAQLQEIMKQFSVKRFDAVKLENYRVLNQCQ